MHFPNENCTGQAFSSFDNIISDIDGVLHVTDVSSKKEEIRGRSGGNSGYASWSTGQYFPYGDCINGDFVVNARPLIQYNLAQEIANAAYPVRLEQLP